MPRDTLVKQGCRSGKLTVVGQPFKVRIKGARRSYCVCFCQCGKYTIKPCADLHNGNVKSCGCGRYENRVKKHGMSDTRLYRIWRSMMDRCKPDFIAYKNYAGKGVTVCESWRNSIEVFCDWALKNGYNPKLQLDRINNDGNYEPSNCRFVTSSENCRNRSSNCLITAFGETKTLVAWSEDIRAAAGCTTIQKRIMRGWTGEDAISTPVEMNRRCKSFRDSTIYPRNT